MKRAAARLDSWIHGFVPVTPEGLAICRIVFASFYLLYGLPWFAWTARNPAGFLNPSPLNIAAVLSDFPSVAAMKTLDVLVGICFICLLVGFRTRLVSIILTMAWMLGDSVRFSFGKIDCEMIVVAVPAIMAFAGWGDFYSIDARRRTGEAPAPRTWPVSLLALLIGFGFLSAGVPKLMTWIDFDPSTQGARSWLMFGWSDGRQALLAPLFVRINSPWFWEIADYMAVIFEMTFIFSLVSLRAFRSFVFVAIVFHVTNLLMLNIGFETFLPMYLIFAPWERVAPHAARAVGRSLNRIGSAQMLGALLVLFLPLYALEDRLTADAALSHIGVVANLTGRFDFPWTFSVIVHGVALVVACAFAGLPTGIRSSKVDRVPSAPIVFFDGVWNLCNSYVDFLVRHDRRRVLRLASLQSPAGREIDEITRRAVPGDGVQTIVLLNVDGQIYTRSDAVLMMVGHFGGPYRLAGALWLVPRIARDVVYRLISRYRYALFGQRVTCRMPVADEQSVFLDAANTSGI